MAYMQIMETSSDIKDLLIVVPYRNRQEHLEGFLKNSPSYFDHQNLTYDILICELEQKGDWNAGLCVNSLVKFVSEQRRYKYLYVHHVDVWPVEGTWTFPQNKQVYFNLGDYGSCLMSIEAFFNVNGYSNSFWGWGGEDNELYLKLQNAGYEVIDSEKTFPVKYDTKFQNHERKFNGANYGNGIKNLMIIPEQEKNNIKHFDEHATVCSVVKLKENIYKQIVCPLKVSARETTNNKIILGYLKGETDFNNIVPFVKSAMLYAGYSYDVGIVIADETLPEHLIHELKSFGVIPILHIPLVEDLFIDRYLAFKAFLLKTPQYTTVLHADVTDVVFQDDPFKHFDNTKLTFSSEGIKIKDETWNKTGIETIYGREALNIFGDKDVVCGGIIGGPSQAYIDLAAVVIREHEGFKCNIRGTDQPYLQRIIYGNGFFKENREIKQLSDTFCINLHVCYYYPVLFNNLYKIVNNEVLYNKNDKKFAIVHQYNRINDLYTNLYQHYKTYFSPL